MTEDYIQYQELSRPSRFHLAPSPRNALRALYFHGTPSCRLEWLLFGSEDLASSLGLRVIVPDRPGCGWSDLQPGRRISDWPDDLSQVADHLGLQQFAVLGYSGGGPYAIAPARQLADRISAVGVASCTGPHDVPGLTAGISPDSLRFMNLARDKPGAARPILRMMRLTARW